MAFISYSESMRILKDLPISPVGVERVFLGDALGRVLAEDTLAPENSPLYPTSAMDGYAVRYEDQKLGELAVLGVNPAGSLFSGKVLPGGCIKTFTGSLMPEGADTIIPIENVLADEEKIKITQPVERGFAVRPIGENYREGEILIRQGTVLSYAQIGVMASLNTVMPLVYQKPRIAIFSTGSEVVDLGQQITRASQIRSSNNYTIMSLATLHGAQAVQLGCVADEKESIEKMLKRALESADIVVTTGGVSVGDYDYVKDVIRDLGAEVVFKGVNIKPGQHVMVARMGNKYIVGLPGFAYSSTVTFILYVLPLIRGMLGLEPELSIVEATLAEDFVKKTKKTEFTACNIASKNGQLVVDFKGKRSGTSAIMTNLLGPAALMVSYEHEANKKAGEKVLVILPKGPLF